MNSKEYLEKLRHEVIRSTLLELVLLPLLGILGIGIWLIGILDPLPSSIYENLTPGNKSFVQLIFWGFGISGFWVIGLSLWATIALWHQRKQPESHDDLF